MCAQPLLNVRACVSLHQPQVFFRQSTPVDSTYVPTKPSQGVPENYGGSVIQDKSR